MILSKAKISFVGRRSGRQLFQLFSLVLPAEPCLIRTFALGDVAKKTSGSSIFTLALKMYGAIFPSNIFLIAFLLHNLPTCQAIIDLDSTMKYFNSPKFSLAIRYFKDDFTKFVRSIASELATSVASRAKELYDNLDAYDNDILTGSYIFQKRGGTQPKENRLYKGRLKVVTDDSSWEVDQTSGLESVPEETLSANKSSDGDSEEARHYLRKTSTNLIEEEKLNKFESDSRRRLDHRKVRKNSTRRKNAKRRFHSPVSANSSDIANSKIGTVDENELESKVKIEQTHDRIALINPLIQDMLRKNERVQQEKADLDKKMRVSNPSSHQDSDVESLHREKQVIPTSVTDESHNSKIYEQKLRRPGILNFVSPEIINYIKKNRLDQTMAITMRVKDVNSISYARPNPSNSSVLDNFEHLESVKSKAQISKTDQRDDSQISLKTIPFVNPNIVQNTGQNIDSRYQKLSSTMSSDEGLPKLGKMTTQGLNMTLQRKLNPSAAISETYQEQEKVTEIPNGVSTVNVALEEEPKLQVGDSPKSVVDSDKDHPRYWTDWKKVTSMKSIHLDSYPLKSTSGIEEQTERIVGVGEKLIAQQERGKSENVKSPESETEGSFFSNNPMNERQYNLSTESISSENFTGNSNIDFFQNTFTPSSKPDVENFGVYKDTVILKTAADTDDKQTTLSEDKKTVESLGETQFMPLKNVKLLKGNVTGKNELIIDDIQKSQNFIVDLPNFPDFEPEMEKIDVNSKPKLGQLAKQFVQENTTTMNSESLIARSGKIGSEIGIKHENREESTQTFKLSNYLTPEFFSPTTYDEDDRIETSSSLAKENKIFNVSSSPNDFDTTDSAEDSLNIPKSAAILEREQVTEKMDATVGIDMVYRLRALERANKIDNVLNFTSSTDLSSMFQDEVNKENFPSRDTIAIKSPIENVEALSTFLNRINGTESYSLLSSTSRIMIRKGTPNYQYSARPHRVLPKSRIRKRAAKDTFMNIIETRWSELNNEEAEYEEISTDDSHYEERIEHEMTERYRCPHTNDLEKEDPRSSAVQNDEDISLRKQAYESESPVQEGITAKLLEICRTLNSVGHKNKTKMIFFEQPVAREKMRAMTLNLLPKLKRSFKDKESKTQKNATERIGKWNNKSESARDLEAESDRLLDLALGKFEDKLKSIIQSNWPRRNVRDPTQTIHHSQLKRPSNRISKVNKTFHGNHTADSYQSEQPNLLEAVDEVEGIVKEEEMSKIETPTVPPEVIIYNKLGITGSDEQQKSTLNQNRTSKSLLDAESIDERRRALTYSTAQRGESIRLNNTKFLQRKKEESVVSVDTLEHQTDKKFPSCSSCATVSTSVHNGINQTDHFMIHRLKDFNTIILKSLNGHDERFDQNTPQYTKLQLPITVIGYSDPIRNSAPAATQPNKSKHIYMSEEFQGHSEDASVTFADSDQSNFKDSSNTMSTFTDIDGPKSRIFTRTYPNIDNIMRLNKKLEKITQAPGDAPITYSERPQTLQKSIENFKKIAKLNWELLKNIEADESFSISEFNPSVLDSPPSSTEYTENLHLHTSEFNEEEEVIRDAGNKTRKIILPPMKLPQKLRIDFSQAELQSNKQYHQTGKKYFNNSNVSFQKEHNSTEDVSKSGDFVKEDTSQSYGVLQNKNSLHEEGRRRMVMDSHNCSTVMAQEKCNSDTEFFSGDLQIPKSTEEQLETESDHVSLPNDKTDEEIEAELSMHQQRLKLDHETLLPDNNFSQVNVMQQESWTLNRNHDLKNGSEFSGFHHGNKTSIQEQNERTTEFIDLELGPHQGGSDSEQLENPESVSQQEYVADEIDSQEADSLSPTDESADNYDSSFMKSPTTPVGVPETESTSTLSLVLLPAGNNLPPENSQQVSNRSSSWKNIEQTPNLSLDVLKSFIGLPTEKELLAVSKHSNGTKLHDRNIVTLRMSQQLELKATPAQIEHIQRSLTKSVNSMEGQRVTTHRSPNAYFKPKSQSHGTVQHTETIHHELSDSRHHRIDVVNGFRNKDTVSMEDTTNFTKDPLSEEVIDILQTRKESRAGYQDESFNYQTTKNLESHPKGHLQREKKIRIAETDRVDSAEKQLGHWSFTTARYMRDSQKDRKATDAGFQTDEPTSSRPSRKRQRGKSMDRHRYKVLQLPELQATATLIIYDTTDDPSNHEPPTTRKPSEKSHRKHNILAARFHTDDLPTSNPLRMRQRGKKTSPHHYTIPEQLKQQIIITVMGQTTTENEIMTEKMYTEESKQHKSLVTKHFPAGMVSPKHALRKENRGEKRERHRFTNLPQAETQKVTPMTEKYSEKPSHQRSSAGKHERIGSPEWMEESPVEQIVEESKQEQNLQKRTRTKQRQFYDRMKPKLYGEQVFTVSLTKGKTKTEVLTPLKGTSTSTVRMSEAISSGWEETEKEFQSSSLKEKRGRGLQRRDRKAKRRRVTTLKSMDLDEDEEKPVV